MSWHAVQLPLFDMLLLQVGTTGETVRSSLPSCEPTVTRTETLSDASMPSIALFILHHAVACQKEPIYFLDLFFLASDILARQSTN